MPNYKTHLVGGFCSFFLMNWLLSLMNVGGKYAGYRLPLFLGMSLLGSLFPDIDIKSKMQRIFYFFAFFFALLALYLGRPSQLFFVAILVVTVPHLHHRTVTHRMGFLVAMPMIIALYCSYCCGFNFTVCVQAASFFIGGALSHIFLDNLKTKAKKVIFHSSYRS